MTSIRIPLLLLSIGAVAFSQTAAARRITQIVSTATGRMGIAPSSLGSISGVAIASTIEPAQGSPLPLTWEAQPSW